MSDPDYEPQSEQSEVPAAGGSYRLCEACGMFIPADAEYCPECGAAEGEETRPISSPVYNVTLASVVVLVLAIALLVLSRGRDAARAAELERLGWLSPARAVVVPTPTPTPLPPTPTPPPPTPTPTPRPTPTPIPFDPGMLDATPTPTPPPPPPTPTPTPRRSRTLELKDELALEYTKQLDERIPLAKVDDFVRLTLVDGRVISGNIRNMAAGQVQIATPDGAVWVNFRQLTPESRLRVDAGERATWVEERALQEVLRRLNNP